MLEDGSLCLAEVPTYYERVSFRSTSTVLHHTHWESCDSFALAGVQTPHSNANGQYIVSPVQPEISLHPHFYNIEHMFDSQSITLQYHVYYFDGKWVLDDDTDPRMYISSHVGSTRFVTTPCHTANLTEQKICSITSRGVCNFTANIVQKVEQLVKSPHNIDFDADSYGEIFDGGDGLYDGGNRIFTSLCPYDQLSPYSDNFHSVPSQCFGIGGSYAMNKGASTLILATVNSHDADIDVYIKGNLGSDGDGISFSWEFQ